MKNIRLIARLDIKGSNLIKSVQLEGLRVIGSAEEYAYSYYLQGADELILMDCVASLYGRNNLSKIVEKISRNIFVPITVGGGLRTIENVTEVFRSGADKVAINTGAVHNPNLISKVAKMYGSQSIVLSIEAKKKTDNQWQVFTDNGRENSGLDVVEWAIKGVEKGAGEILLTSIDREGTRKGFDLDLVRVVSKEVKVPLIASGGMGFRDHLAQVVFDAGADAVAMADILHYSRDNLIEIRGFAREVGIDVRSYP